MRILLDMDEVLCDFVGGALRAHGWTRARLTAAWPVGTWSIVGPMGLTEADFWKPIDAGGKQFWTTLEPTPWLDDMLQLANRHGDEWFVVSSPSRSPGAYAGKYEWMQRYIGQPTRLVLTSYKYLLARPDSLLIDDREETIYRFVEHGGRGILFPSRHNSLYAFANDPVSYVSRHLQSLA